MNILNILRKANNYYEVKNEQGNQYRRTKGAFDRKNINPDNNARTLQDAD